MLDVRNLTYEVIENGEKNTIVKDINFTVGDGEMLVITGPNGGGKSTVAKLLMGVLATSNGEILLDGKDITGMSLDERANAGIGYAFQQPPAFKGMTIRRLLKEANLSLAACFGEDLVHAPGEKEERIYFVARECTKNKGGITDVRLYGKGDGGGR